MTYYNTFVTVTTIVLAFQQAHARHFYVDCSQSCPGSGTVKDPWCSIAEANDPTFQPGDTLAFKSGTSCAGQLAPKGVGTAEAVITITKYGPSKSANPVINGTGAAAAVKLTNQDYWQISNLTVTNPASSLAQRQGIHVTATDGKSHAGITIESNTVQFVAGQTNKATHAIDFANSCGILIDTANEGSRYDHVLVQNNQVSDCGGGGIKVRVGSMENRGRRAHVTKNAIKQCGGDGIIISYSHEPVIDYNLATDLGTGAYPYTGGNFAGMWVLGDHNPTIRYNVVYGSIMSVVDSQAFDCDWGNTGNCTVEYNFSRDNAGGAFLDCDGCGTSGGADQIVRYNIFQNDCRINSNSDKPTLYFYQNVMYCPDKDFDLVLPASTIMTNNIFVGNGKSKLPTGSSIEWNWNVFQNVERPTSNGIAGDPMFLDPGKGTDSLMSASGYKLKASSPALSNGDVVPDNGGRDYFGNIVSATEKPNRGAYNGPGLKL